MFSEAYKNSISKRNINIINSAQEGSYLITKQVALKNSFMKHLIPLQLWKLKTLFGDGLINFLTDSL